MDDAVGMLVRGRTAKQDRSERTRSAIVSAVIDTLAAEGMAGLTHRLVAKRSGAPLAATTYYFDSKRDMVAAASNELLHTFLSDFTGSAARIKGGGEAGFFAFVAKLCADGVTDPRRRALAWCEIILESPRHPDGQALVRTWFDRLVFVWEQIARAHGVADPARAAAAGLAIGLGAIFQGLALGLSRRQLLATFGGRPADFGTLGQASAVVSPVARMSPRAAATRERILDAAIRLLSSGGAGAVNCRAVALEAELTPGTAAYHFASSKALLAEAETLLYLRSKSRYDAAMTEALDSRDLESVMDLMTTILKTEASEHGAVNRAGYGVWLQAARDPEVRPLMRDITVELYEGWRRTLKVLGVRTRGPEPLMMQYLFFGEVIRAMTSGVTPEYAMDIRKRLAADVGEMVKGRHWVQSAALAA